ncbi:MAG: FKBP-type peptidyl-prolyl cis-trans isomerase [Candidatus Delongbacteria bacterium]
MKCILANILMIFFMLTIFSCSGEQAEESEVQKRSDLKSKAQMESYVFGMDLAEKLQSSPEYFEYHSFMRGFNDHIKKRPPLLTEAEMEAVREQGRKESGKNLLKDNARSSEAEKNRRFSERFLSRNKAKDGVIETRSGLQYEVLQKGKGATAVPGDKVKVHFIARKTDGEEFDNTYEKNEPVELVLGGSNLMRGWEEGLKLMNEGSKYTFYIPPKLAYGDKGKGIIGPNSVLIFEVELLEIIN